MATKDLKLTKKERAMLYFPEGLSAATPERDKNNNILEKDKDKKSDVVENFNQKIINICKEFVDQLPEDTNFKYDKDSNQPYGIGVYFLRNESNKNKESNQSETSKESNKDDESNKKSYFIGLDPQAVVKKDIPEKFVFQIDFCVTMTKEKSKNYKFLPGLPTYIRELIDTKGSDSPDCDDFWYCKSLNRKLLIDLDNPKNKEKFFKKAKESLDNLLIWEAIMYNSSKS